MTFFDCHSLCIEHLVIPIHFQTLKRERHVAKKKSLQMVVYCSWSTKISSSNFSKNLTKLCNNIASVQDSEYCKLEFWSCFKVQITKSFLNFQENDRSTYFDLLSYRWLLYSYDCCRDWCIIRRVAFGLSNTSNRITALLLKFKL